MNTITAPIMDAVALFPSEEQGSIFTKPALSSTRASKLARLKELEAAGYNREQPEWLIPKSAGNSSKSAAQLEQEALATLAALPAGQLEATLANMTGEERRALVGILARYR